GAPRHRGDHGYRPEVRRRIAVTVEAEAHAQRFLLAHALHGVDASVARDASHAGGEVDAVIEIGVIGEHVHAHPMDGGVRGVAGAHRGELLALGLDELVTVHAGFGGRDGRLGRSLDGVVTVTTVDAELTRVQPVAERHWLGR